MKKVYMLLVCATLLFLLGGCGGKTFIGQRLTPEDYEKTPTIKSVPDLGLFLGRRGQEAIEHLGSGEQKVPMESEEDLQLVLEYIDLLQSDEFGFEIVGSENYDPESEAPFGEEFYEGKWDIAFAGTKIDGGREMESPFSEVACDVHLRGAGKTLYLVYSGVFEIVDCGHRYTGYEGDKVGELVGERAAEAFFKKGKKYCNNGDEELTVTGKVREEYDWTINYVTYVAYKGESTVIVNGGKPQTGTARIEKDWKTSSKAKNKIDCFQIKVEDFDSTRTGEELYVALPLEIQEGEVLRLTDFLSNHQRDAEETCYEFGYTPDFNYSRINAEYYTKKSGSAEGCTVRVLQWDSTGEKDCVLYISAVYWVDAEQVTLEALIAAPVNIGANLMKRSEMEEKEESGKGSGLSIFDNDDTSDGPYIPEHSKLNCLTCGGDGDCNTCGGSGVTYSYLGAGESLDTKCKTCYGSGHCRTCNGSGKRD